MATFFMATLAISIAGMVSLLCLKRWEMESGRIILRRSRPSIGQFFHSVLVLFERAAPEAARRASRALLYTLRVWAHHLVAWGALVAERLLESTLRILKHKTSEPPRDASPFLREVAAHKKKLLRRAPKNRVILDE